MLGGISSREGDEFCAVEVSFHDAARHRRVPLLTDFYHFSMASLSAAVCISSPVVQYCNLSLMESAFGSLFGSMSCQMPCDVARHGLRTE